MNEHHKAEQSIDALYDELLRDGEASGYYLNPDVELTRFLIEGLIANENKYGYRACPCRLASGNKGEDLDIICPCDYRDADLNEYDACYCALYVSEAVLTGEKSAHSIPERRLPAEQRTKKVRASGGQLSRLPHPVWRCKVCGYLCARGKAPEVCPICKAKADRFERFI
ncbi:MAG: ferredoxin-thioredoxin reductase catalytic domain-containing protein [Dehalococcoidia bacterium]